LLLFTHQSDQPAQIIIEQAMRATLRDGSAASLEFYSEYLDAVRAPLEDYEQELLRGLQRKYEKKKFDLIIAVNPPALKLLLLNRARLFPEVPIVFMVLDQKNLDGLTLGSNVTGVWGERDYKSELELALALRPGTKNVVVVSGVGEWDNYWRSLVQKEFRSHADSVEFSYLTGLSIPELKKELANLPPQTIVFFVSSTQDAAGNNPGNLEVVRQISPSSSAPIFGGSDAQLGLGIVGGRVTSFAALGVEVAHVGLRIMASEKADAIAPHGVPAVPMFDARELNRWSISEDRLPPGSVVKFKEPSFWQQYRGRIIGVMTLIMLQSFFIGLLLVERKRRQRAKEALDKLNLELEQRIAARTAALAAKSRELETFAYSVAHDLKAPLRGIEGYSRLLLEDHIDDLNDEGRGFLKTIRTSTEEMDQLIGDLLDYSRLERRELKSDRIELKALVKSVVEQAEREVAGRGLDVAVNVNGGFVHADVNGLTQALKNYLDNAIKFTKDVTNPRIEIGSEESRDSCRIWVRDNGVGFDNKYKDRIFDIFQRLNRSEDYPGTGIGLAIVRKSMERMGGRAWGEGEPGRGATFYLEIPK
jgi:signal transduction histidine kinase